MDLWIRSQDRERLTHCCDIRVYYDNETNMWALDSCDVVGYYVSKERALEVLDKIQSILVGKNLIKLKANLSPFNMNHLKKAFRTDAIIETPLYEVFNSTNNIIYEMPKE